MKNNIDIRAYWTNEIKEKAIDDFIKIQNNVFFDEYTHDKFHTKYFQNIYGDSLIILAYSEDKCVGARAFWRNDLKGKLAFQPCDSAVLLDYRSKGIFTKMTLYGLNVISNDAMIYNFPNDNSYPVYIKLGWELKEIKRFKFLMASSDLKVIPIIEKEYCNWILNNRIVNNSIYYM